ncbi:hypothetical protein KKF38_00340 [Patescibacteria group bacterium]|nr:hypothetical protein [Patescibacteria group bacterium]
MKNSLPDIKIPMVGKFQATIGSISCSIGDLTGTLEKFEKNFRGPILAFCTRTEFLIDDLIEVISFYILGIDYSENNRRFFSEKLFKNYFNLNCKLNLLRELLIEAETKIHKTKQVEFKDKKELVKLMKNELETFRKTRNKFAHAQTSPRVNSKNGVVDVVLVEGEKETKIDKCYINKILKNLQILNSALAEYRQNFQSNKNPKMTDNNKPQP